VGEGVVEVEVGVEVVSGTDCECMDRVFNGGGEPDLVPTPQTRTAASNTVSSSPFTPTEGVT
jgi:hypothetical protein